MASLDSLPADQKAVLSLVLQRGRSFDQIAALLSIDRAAVRQRALEGFDALGPSTSLDPLKRSLITDYLLGQLPDRVAGNVRASLAANPPERAWARIIAAEIAPLAVHGLPEIPAAASRAPQPEPDQEGDYDPGADQTDYEPGAEHEAGTEPQHGIELEPAAGGGLAVGSELTSESASQPARRSRATTAAGSPTGVAEGTSRGGEAQPTAPRPSGTAPRSSRRGGAILLGLIALAIIVVVVVLLVTGGSAKKHSSTTAATKGTSTSQTATTGTSTGAKVLHQINLTSPTNVKNRAGVADVLNASGTIGIVLDAQGLAANKNNAYAVWLYNAKTGAADRLGFYTQTNSKGKQIGVTSNGKMITEAKLPANAAKKYNELLLTLETSENPTKPGTIVLEGSFAE